ncbi:SCO family protein [Sporosarcina sp. Marseille-Q4063]|uniref:SCO family protein n=1 Tax=Sporosarcina sp. Marseille-Q4063 TaxID=2810514 RepID=UPI001BAF42E0|nr:SCO family protein [Sporosarcina sp. Marseille-Q4063]QUW22327.1 SCO family protein [Sporosarcina sp. Marseille-Q4063]
MHKFFRTSFVLLIVLILGACSGNEFKPDYKLKIEPFTFTNQHNEEVSLDDLKGEVWLAQFVFSNCTSVCGPMMVNMAELQDKLIKEKVEDYKIVSFTVDPAVDSPEVLQGYLDLFAPSDESKWEMLTGYKQDEIAEIAKKSFATIVADDPNSDQVTHGVSFALVNQEGLVVKLYNGNDDVPFDDIVKDMKALIKQGA